MQEKFIKVEVCIDATSSEQLNLLYSFLSKVGKHVSSLQPAPAQDGPRGTTTDLVPPASAPETKRGRKPSKPAEPAPAPEPEPTPAPAPQPEPEPAGEKKAPEYKIEEVREKLKEKVSEHREEIKAKLSELGAPNVSNLDPEKYNEFMEFLNGLA